VVQCAVSQSPTRIDSDTLFPETHLRTFSANQFFVAIFVALVFLVVDTFVRPYHDFRCNALKVLTSMSMLITLLCGFASKLDWRNEVVSDNTLGWTLIVSFKQSVCGCNNLDRVC
jgi:predicted small integral membrane protein